MGILSYLAFAMGIAIIYAVIRGVYRVCTKDRRASQAASIAEFRQLIIRRATQEKIPYLDAERLILEEGHTPPHGWVSYLPRD